MLVSPFEEVLIYDRGTAGYGNFVVSKSFPVHLGSSGDEYFSFHVRNTEREV